MGEVNRRGKATATREPSGFAPTVRISLGALDRNLRAALADERASRVIDVRRDAWGHGARTVARAARDAGAQGLLADHAVSAAELGVPGLPVAYDAETVDAARVWGLPDAHGRLRGIPVMSLRGRVLSTKALLAGEGVSYGYTYRAPSDTRIALVTGGYGQGVVRALGNRVSVAVGSTSCPVIGRVAMDVCVVDIGDLDIERGEAVDFFGDPAADAPALHAWVRATGMGAAEIVTTVGARADRRELVA